MTLSWFRVNGELKVDGINERMKALLERNEREEREMMFDTIIQRGWRADHAEPGMFRKDLPYLSYMVMNLDDAYEYEIKNFIN